MKTISKEKQKKLMLILKRAKIDLLQSQIDELEKQLK